MLRLIFGMFFTVTVSRWIYAETKIIAPGAVPFIDSILAVAQIPTHDQWDGKKFVLLVASLDQRAGELLEKAKTEKLDFEKAATEKSAPAKVSRGKSDPGYLPVSVQPSPQLKFERF